MLADKYLSNVMKGQSGYTQPFLDAIKDARNIESKIRNQPTPPTDPAILKIAAEDMYNSADLPDFMMVMYNDFNEGKPASLLNDEIAHELLYFSDIEDAKMKIATYEQKGS